VGVLVGKDVLGKVGSLVGCTETGNFVGLKEGCNVGLTLVGGRLGYLLGARVGVLVVGARVGVLVEGRAVGDFVGMKVGDDGVMVGTIVGRTEGKIDGSRDGNNEGDTDGISDGFSEVGNTVGIFDGLTVGTLDGISEGTTDGIKVPTEGKAEGGIVRATVGNLEGEGDVDNNFVGIELVVDGFDVRDGAAVVIVFGDCEGRGLGILVGNFDVEVNVGETDGLRLGRFEGEQVGLLLAKQQCCETIAQIINIGDFIFLCP